MVPGTTWMLCKYLRQIQVLFLQTFWNFFPKCFWSTVGWIHGCRRLTALSPCPLLEERENQFSSITQSCPTLGDPMDCSTPGFSVHHQLLELAQIHVHQVSDVIHPSHPLSSPSPPALNLSQHQGLFKWVSSSHQVAKVLEFQLQHQFFQWIFRTDFL